MTTTSITPDTCDCCGYDAVCEWQYACGPHVKYDSLCSSCAVTLTRDLLADADCAENAVIPQTPDWYLRKLPTDDAVERFIHCLPSPDDNA